MTDTDRTLLEKAARAADILLPAGEVSVACTDEGWGPWNPLLDDGDAFRLAVKLGIGTRHHEGWSQVFQRDAGIFDFCWHSDDYCAATRRAIVEAAAALGGSK